MNFPTHISDTTTIIDKNMTFGEYKTTSEYQSNLASVIRDVKSGQHLRFIGSIYKTHQVCVFALKAHSYGLACMCCVASTPSSIRAEVLHDVVTDNPRYYDKLSEEYKELLVRTKRE